jgi:signal transduction histidine kinase
VANRWFDDVVDPLFDRDGDLIGAVHVLTDITERRHIEREKRRLQEQLAHAQKMQAVGTLAGGIAHEFNNINGEIIAFVDLTLELEDLPAVARRYLEAVRSSAVAGTNLTQSLLAFSRKGVGQKRPVSLNCIVENVLRVVEKQLAAEGVQLVVRPPEEPVIVLGDAPMLESALMNLVINARHAMLRSEAKRMTVETGFDGEKPFIRVTDTGCGIPPEYLDRVFEPFFTTKGALATGEVFDGKVHGTGLGLSVCHTIAEAHGGEVLAQSELAKGSTFTIYLSPSLRQKPATPVSGRK